MYVCNDLFMFPLLRLCTSASSLSVLVLISKRNVVCIIVVHSITQYLPKYIGVCHDLFSGLSEHN